jgi:hypothetical protein
MQGCSSVGVSLLGPAPGISERTKSMILQPHFYPTTKVAFSETPPSPFSICCSAFTQIHTNGPSDTCFYCLDYILVKLEIL